MNQEVSSSVHMVWNYLTTRTNDTIREKQNHMTLNVKTTLLRINQNMPNTRSMCKENKRIKEDYLVLVVI